MSHMPFKSGLPLTTVEKPRDRSINNIVDSAIQAKRLRKRLHQRYDSELTMQVKHNTSRMLGERDD